MKIASLVTKAIILCIVVSFSIFKTNSFYQDLKKPQKFDFYFDRFISNKTQSKIQEFFNLNKDLDLGCLTKKFIQEFDFAYNVTLKKDLKSTKVFIKISRPILNINNKFIITDTKKITSILSYKQNSISDLPVVLVNSANIDDSVVNFLLNLNYEIYLKYDVEIKDNFNVYLKNKKSKKFFILTNLYFVPTKKNLKICKNLFYEKINSIKKNKNLVADIRFEKQIILFQI